MPKQYCLNICFDTLNIHSILQRVMKQYQMTWSPGMLFLRVLPYEQPVRRGQINFKDEQNGNCTKLIYLCKFSGLGQNSLLSTADKGDDTWNLLWSLESNKEIPAENFS